MMDEPKQNEELIKKLQSRVTNRIPVQRTPLKLNPLEYGSGNGSATGECNLIVYFIHKCFLWVIHIND